MRRLETNLDLRLSGVLCRAVEGEYFYASNSSAKYVSSLLIKAVKVP